MWVLLGLLYVGAVIAVFLSLVTATWVSLVIAIAAAAVFIFAWATR